MTMLWDDVDRDLVSARRHFGMGVALFADLRASTPGRDRYAAMMAFLHAMQSGYTSFEAGTKRLLTMLDEPLPTGAEWHEDLVRRIAVPVLGSRPALLDDRALHLAVSGLLGFRHVAAHVDDELDDDRAAVAVRHAETFLAGIGPSLARFRATIDPD